MNLSVTPPTPPVPDDTAEREQSSPAERNTPRLQDRSEQRLTSFIGALFTVGSFLCLIALAVLTLFFVSVVAQGGEVGMVPILTALGLSLVLGMLMLEFTHARALAGYRAAREHNARRSRAIASGVLCVLLGMIHPLMGLAIPVSAGIGWLGHMILHRFGDIEPAWDFLPREATSILSGRDQIGLQMAGQHAPSHVMAGPVTRAGSVLSVLVAVASGSYLLATDVMAMAAFVPLIVASYWATQEILDYSAHRFSRRDGTIVPAAFVDRIAGEETAEPLGLNVRDLTLRLAGGGFLMADVNLEVEPGQITGILGPSGSGKSLLLQAIADPHSLSGVEVAGSVQMGQTDLWHRYSRDQTLPAIYLPPEPILLPASGIDNLTCFHREDMLSRGKWFLKQLVFDIDLVEGICNASDARQLPSVQRKALAIARAFVLGPSLYLFDTPEGGLPDKQIGAVAHRLKQEARMGRSVLLVTHNRALLETCDRLIVLQQGRIVDYGPAAEVRGRMESGWSRFVGLRIHETETILINWVRSHFFRDGDEPNRRSVAAVASDLLAFSCQSTDAREPGKVQFLFKHFEGYCLLRMRDRDPPVGNSTLRKARAEANSAQDRNRLSLLGSVMRSALEVECGSKQDDREITVKIETFDPRKKGQRADAS